VLILWVLGLVLNEIAVAVSASRVADRVPTQELDSLPEAWNEYHVLSERSFGIATIALERSLVAHTGTLTDRIISKYRAGVSTVWAPEWRMAREALARVGAATGGTRRLRASLRYCDGHLQRIAGDAHREKKQAAAAQQAYAEAVAAFREAAQLRSDWPDPFLGLARTFISGLGDVDRGADALKQAEELGHPPGEREITQLADGYRARGETLIRRARQLAGMPQEESYLTRAAAAYQEALTQYSRVVSADDVPRKIRTTQRGLERVQRRLDDLTAPAIAAAVAHFQAAVRGRTSTPRSCTPTPSVTRQTSVRPACCVSRD
jgi:hypothetical protein